MPRDGEEAEPLARVAEAFSRVVLPQVDDRDPRLTAAAVELVGAGDAEGFAAAAVVGEGEAEQEG